MSKIWAIGDLHLSFGIPGKNMDVFGKNWTKHAEKTAKHWHNNISENDLVLIPGDISWAMRSEDALPDLQWIDQLPGTKLLLRGNHDYWWSTLSKVKKILPPSIHVIHNNSFLWNNIAIAGTRLWDSPEYYFDEIIEIKNNPKAKKQHQNDDLAIFERELNKLELSLKTIPKDITTRIAITHYPPIGLQLQPSRTSQILEKYNINIAIFGHIHSFKKDLPPLFGECNNIKYILASADYIDFSPILIANFEAL
jgi:uncharacterized protein